MILFNDLKPQYLSIREDINIAIQRVLDSGWYILGPELEKFEIEFASYIGSRYCVGVASGTEAIALSLMSIGVSEGDEVITANITAYPTITGIEQSGASPVVVDILHDTGLINPEKIIAKITPRTKAIIPVHLYGQACDMDIIASIASKYNLQIVEDCAQSVGTSYKGKLTGNFGICGAFSFYPTKNLGAQGDAGAIITNSVQVRDKLMMLRNYGQSVRYRHDTAGINSRLDEIQAAILRVKLKHIDEWNAKRHIAATYYRQNLQMVECLKTETYGKPNYHLFVIKTKYRDQLIEHLKINEIQSFIHYPIPINKQKAFKNQKDEDLIGSYTFASEILSIPLYPEIELSSLTKVVKSINEFKY